MSEAVNISLMSLNGVFALVNWYAAFREHRRIFLVTKPLVLAILIASFALNGGTSQSNIPFLAGLLLSLLGDIFLLVPGRTWFIVGAAAFGLAQVAYTWGFNLSPASPLAYLAGLAIYLLFLFFSFRYVDRVAAEAQEMKTPLPLFKGYWALVSLMGISALLCFARPGWSVGSSALAAAGGVLFMISDFLIGLGKMEVRLPRAHFGVMSTYHLAQFLIVASVLAAAS